MLATLLAAGNSTINRFKGNLKRVFSQSGFYVLSPEVFPSDKDLQAKLIDESIGYP